MPNHCVFSNLILSAAVAADLSSTN